jgi:hypothetical protein
MSPAIPNAAPRQIGHRKIAHLEPLALQMRHPERACSSRASPVALLGLSPRLLDLPKACESARALSTLSRELASSGSSGYLRVTTS